MSFMVRTALAKIAAFWLVFVVLHFAYDWWPTPFTASFSGINEAFAQHAKIGVVGYSLACAGEYLLARRGKLPSGFLAARLLSTLILPWIMFVLWYIAPITVGRWPMAIQEIIYSNLILLLMAAVLVLLEREVERLRFSRLTSAVLLVLYLVCLVELVVFTFHIPWADFFRG